MQVSEDISLREYLHLLERRIKDPPCLDRYDEFLIKVWEFFALRATAEDNYSRNLHLAYSKHGALPISWEQVRDTWSKSGPPEQIITRIAKKYFNDVNMLLGNMRKVLNRVRQKVALGRVQQVDSHCLRWLTRQPGLTPAEKGGARQEILGVVRVENYNTLENRVLKDFLWRCLGLTTMYLRRYKERFPHHATIKAVVHFRNLCVTGLSTETMKDILDLHEMPQPNYVLQQDKLYSKVWNAYTTILRQEDVAERLWTQRKDVDDLYRRCVDGIELHCSPCARYRTPLWINELDGRQPIFEEPIWENELAAEEIVEPALPSGEDRIINLTFPWDDRDELIYPFHHKNARPFLQNPHRPSLENGNVVSLNNILQGQNGNQLADYFRQLYGHIGGTRWIVLTPDGWNADWQEAVVRARPQSLVKDRFFLLWRRVAAALGMMECKSFADGDQLVIADGYRVATYNAVNIRFLQDERSGRIVPQRASVRLHSETNAQSADIRFILDVHCQKHDAVLKLANPDVLRICSGTLSLDNFVCSPKFRYDRHDVLLVAGVRRYLREESMSLVSYFDELDALSLVRINDHEEVEMATLIDHKERWPGGTLYKSREERFKRGEKDLRIYAGTLSAGESEMDLYMFEGSPKSDSPLRLYRQKFDERVSKSMPIYFDAEMMPGQGVAVIRVNADFLNRDVELALHDKRRMLDSDMTILRIERELKRHFPPNMPFVEACGEIWDAILPALTAYAKSKKLLDNGLFAKAQNYWGSVDPSARASSGIRRYGQTRFFDVESMSPIERLKRENVFGNNPNNRLPCRKYDFQKLFRGLAFRYKTNPRVLRLIAWTYQYDNAVYEPIRCELFRQYTELGLSLDAVGTSFCCNNFAFGDGRISVILNVAMEHISNDAQNQNELRLLYNLLQFHPESVANCSTALCEKAFNKLVEAYNTYQFFEWDGSLFQKWGGQGATKAAGYYLKCMLFILHRRRFDPAFLKVPFGWKLNRLSKSVTAFSPPGFLGQELPVREYNSRTLENHELMRKSFIEYVNGRGTLEGIPVD